jgi:hypothetical protein
VNFRISFILIILVAVVGGYVLIFELNRRPEKDPEPPYFYDVELTDITEITISIKDTQQSFIKAEHQWVFKDSGNPVDLARWSGIPLLLTGPRAARVLKNRLEDPQEYGVDPPQTHITVKLEGGHVINVVLGHKTPDGLSHYAQVVGFPQLYLVSSTWGDVINRIATEPPILLETNDQNVEAPTY